MMLFRPLSVVIAALGFTVTAFAQGFAVGLKLQHVSVALTTQSITQNTASLNFDISNTLSTSATITRIAAKLGILGLLPILSFDHTFNNLVIPAGGTVNSGNITNVTLSLGLLSSVQIILLPALDVFDTVVTFSNLQQSGVPSNFTLNLV